MQHKTRPNRCSRVKKRASFMIVAKSFFELLRVCCRNRSLYVMRSEGSVFLSWWYRQMQPRCAPCAHWIFLLFQIIKKEGEGIVTWSMIEKWTREKIFFFSLFSLRLEAIFGHCWSISASFVRIEWCPLKGRFFFLCVIFDDVQLLSFLPDRQSLGSFHLPNFGRRKNKSETRTEKQSFITRDNENNK